jgi:hypothetical protein
MIWITICIALVMATGIANAEPNTRAGLPWIAAEKWRGGVPTPPKVVRTIRIGPNGREKPPHPYWPRQVDPAVAR